MNKSSVFFVLLFTFSSTLSAFAGEIYKAHQLNKFSTAVSSLGAAAAEIEDTIPQLGIVVVKSQLKSHAGWSHLGSSQIIKIEKPVALAPKKLWGLKSIQVEDAWVQSMGAGVVVAVSDTGIDSDHPDLAENMWRNSKEILNGVDDDENGYIDDVHGWDFVKNRRSGIDHHYHGTHVAGTIGARISEKMAGVAPAVKLMDVSFLNSHGSGSDVNGAKTIIYAADNGAKIINCSWGSPGRNDLIEEAIFYAQKKGVLVVTAAGNSKQNTDRKAHSPSSLEPENIVSVGAYSNAKGYKSSFSNYGLKTVDLAAPGSNIYSTYPTSSLQKGRYATLNGTSMASPHVAGVAALIWAKYPHLDWKDVKNKVMSSAVPSSIWSSRSVSGGLLNAAQAVR